MKKHLYSMFQGSGVLLAIEILSMTERLERLRAEDTLTE